MKKLIIKPITKITAKEKIELEKLNKKSVLSRADLSRQIFLETKQLWNCEC